LDRKWTNIIIWPRDRASISVQQLRIQCNVSLKCCTPNYVPWGQHKWNSQTVISKPNGASKKWAPAAHGHVMTEFALFFAAYDEI
jgi:hypothetical protein